MVKLRRADGAPAGRRVAVVLALLVPGLTSCHSQASAPTPAPSPTIRTLTPVPLPPPGPPSGRILADLRQSSRDAALGRVQVWIDNDTTQPLDPVEIRYLDPRFRRPLRGERLRLDPAGSERGYPLTLPARPVCAAASNRGPGRLVLTDRSDDRQIRLQVGDDNDLVSRYVTARCLELDVARVARLSFSDHVPVPQAAQGSTSVLTLVVRPTGRSGHRLQIDSVGGTPLLGSVGGTPWQPDALVRGDGPVVRLRLPVRPARCDDHGFMESGGATAFLVRLHLDGRPGQLVVRMSPRGAAGAIAFARASCGR